MGSVFQKVGSNSPQRMESLCREMMVNLPLCLMMKNLPERRASQTTIALQWQNTQKKAYSWVGQKFQAMVQFMAFTDHVMGATNRKSLMVTLCFHQENRKSLL